MTELPYPPPWGVSIVSTPRTTSGTKMMSSHIVAIIRAHRGARGSTALLPATNPE
jgi:hypothetical protein